MNNGDKFISQYIFATFSDTVAVAKDRGYEKPWQTNSKRLKPKETEQKQSGQTFLANTSC